VNSPQPSGPPSKSDEIVVFMVRRETKCAECGRELIDGNLLRMEDNRPLCLDCADLGHLEFLASGNTALTRRATKHSPLRAVVVRWSRTRKRYDEMLMKHADRTYARELVRGEIEKVLASWERGAS
jgi:hypothetical protein